MNKDGHLAFGLVGCGHIGKRHAELIGKYGRLVAVCDVNEEKANHFASTYNTKPYLNFQLLLEKEKDLDVIVICTPNALHAVQSIAALQKGFHVLCEKPMALRSADALEMAKAAISCGRMLHIVKQNRYNAPVAYLKKLLDNGQLGRIYSLSMHCFWNRGWHYYNGSSWKGNKHLDGGIVFTQFSHFIDVACWMFGKMECESALGYNFAHQDLIEFEDTIIALARFDTGVIGTLHFSINAFKENMEGSITVLGEKGSVILGGQYLNRLSYHNVQGLDVPVLLPEGPVNEYPGYKGTMNNHARVYDYFIESLKQGELRHKELSSSILTIDAIETINKALHNII